MRLFHSFLHPWQCPTYHFSPMPTFASLPPTKIMSIINLSSLDVPHESLLYGHPSQPPLWRPSCLPLSFPHRMVTRSKSNIVKLRIVHHTINTSSQYTGTNYYVTSSFSSLMACCNVWWFQCMFQNETWVLVPPKFDCNLVGYKWISRVKWHVDESVQQYKARLVAKSYNQDTLSLMVRPVTIQVVLTLTVTHSWHLLQLNVNNAFLHSPLHNTIYIK